MLNGYNSILEVIIRQTLLFPHPNILLKFGCFFDIVPPTPAKGLPHQGTVAWT